MQNDSSEFEGLIHEMMSKEPFINEDISYINLDGERKLSTVYNLMKEFLSKNEIENRKCHICHNTKTPIELVSDKLIISLDGLNITNSHQQIDNPNYTSLSKNINLVR